MHVEQTNVDADDARVDLCDVVELGVPRSVRCLQQEVDSFSDTVLDDHGSVVHAASATLATAEAGRQVLPSSSVDEERSRRRSAALGFRNSAPDMA